ncbi:MAG: SBBP repeat-containing protein [Bacteroidetes bacterium]|nr:SBBP repeat-containing protein [Bacteroidota bacterium]
MIKPRYKSRIGIVKRTFSPLMVMLFMGSCSAQNIKGHGNPPEPKIPDGYAGQANLQSLKGNGIAFTPNKGQVANMNGKPALEVLYKGDSGGADIYLRKTGISYVYSNMGEVMHEVNEQVEELGNAGNVSEVIQQNKKQELLQKTKVNVHRIDMDFANCNINYTTTVEDESEGYNNYYYAHCPQGITNVHQYNKVTCKNIYNNIDVSYYGNKNSGIKYDIIVQPHADPNQIALHWKGAEELTIEDVHLPDGQGKPGFHNENRATAGRLKIKTSVNEFYESIPRVYQIINGQIIDIKTEYKLTSLSNAATMNEEAGQQPHHFKSYEVSFLLGAYNEDYALIIDPAMWITYYGGNDIEQGVSVTTDNIGNPIFSGFTKSLNFPVQAGAFQAVLGGKSDAFIVKMNPAGVPVFASYIGGTYDDQAYGIDADGNNDIYITGNTHSGNFPTKVWGGAFMQAINFTPIGVANYTAFVAKFSAAGILIWSTYYGGSNYDGGADIITDGNNNIIFTGNARSSNFPIQSAYQPVIANLGGDAFIVKFNNAGIRQWSTFYGGTLSDFASGITVDFANNIYVCGVTNSVNFPVLMASQPAIGGGVDAFLCRLNPVTGFPTWSTYYGGSASDGDWRTVIATDFSGNVLLGLNTFSSNTGNAIATVGAYQQVYAGSVSMGDMALVKFNATGTRLWGTYLGGSNWEIPIGLAADGNDNIYVYGEFEDTDAGNYPISSCAYQPNFGGVEDGFIAKYDPGGNQRCITYIGGSGHDDYEFTTLSNGCGAIAIYGNSLYITGSTYGGYPVSSGAFQTAYGGTWDAFMDKLCINICESKVLGLDYTASTMSVCSNAPIKFTPSIANSCDTTGYKFHWTFTGGSPAVSDSVKPTVTFSGMGTHDVKLVLTTACKKDSITKYSYITTTQCVTCNLEGQFTKGTASCTGCGCKEWILVNATGGTSPYTYLWPDGYTNRYKNQLCPGTYIINIKDKNGCSVNLNLTAP